MTEKDFIPPRYNKDLPEGEVGWEAPSNIALVKYWGKKANQIPANPSISFTLANAVTQTALNYRPLAQRSEDFSFELLFEGKPMESFRPKITTFLSRIEGYFPFLKDYHFKIATSNSFPHSSGIASSASGMAAMALCLMEIEKVLVPEMGEDYFFAKASFIARLGSGSACRSLNGGMVVWGKHPDIEGSSDLYGLPYPYEVHPHFENYQDTILLVHQGEKKVSSTLGHNLMQGHWFAEARFKQATANLSRLRKVFLNGDLETFIRIVESEALTLHAMMMSSDPYFILMKPNTLQIIEKIWDLRKHSKLPVCFTLDAGANVHLLYPEAIKQRVLPFISEELATFCEDGNFLEDQLGKGPRSI